MFGKSKHVRSTKLDTWIGRRTEINGTLRFNGALHVDGVLKGDVSASGDSDKDVLSVSANGKILGEVRVPNVVVNGTVVGDIHASKYLELAAKCQVDGDVHYDTIEMARGAQVNGSLLRIGAAGSSNGTSARSGTAAGSSNGASGVASSFGNDAQDPPTLENPVLDTNPPRQG